MEHSDEALSFDFETVIDTVPTVAAAVAVSPMLPDPTAAAAANAGVAPPSGPAYPVCGGGGNGLGRRGFRQTVCRHWLRGLCMKGDACGFLHQYDKDRMPVCRFYRLCGGCREPDCVYKHTNEDIKECNMYKLGFCPNGPNCRYRHSKLPGPPPSVEIVLQKIQQLSSLGYGSSKYHQRINNSYSQKTYQNQFPSAPGLLKYYVEVKSDYSYETSNEKHQQSLV